MNKFEEIAKKFEVSPDAVKKEYESEVQNLITVLGLDKTVAETLAFDIVRATLRARKLRNIATIEGVVIGTDGRINDWAAIAKKKTKDKMKGLTQQEAMQQNLIDENGRLLYTDDPYREGRPIPEHDISVNYYGVFADNNQLKFGVLDVKNKDVLGKIKSGHQIEVEGTKLSKSNDKMIYIRTREIPKVKKEVNKEKIVEYIQKFLTPITPDKLVSSDVRNQLVYLKRLIIRAIRYEVGANMSTVVELDPGDTTELDTIVVWLPPKEHIPTTLVKGLPINVLGVCAGGREDRSVVVNGIYVYYDKEFEPKTVPQKITNEEETKIVW